jgi:hypothetical protein
MNARTSVIAVAIVLAAGAAAWLATTDAFDDRGSFIRDVLLHKRGTDFRDAKACERDPRARCGPNGEPIRDRPEDRLAEALGAAPPSDAPAAPSKSRLPRRRAPGGKARPAEHEPIPVDPTALRLTIDLAKEASTCRGALAGGKRCRVGAEDLRSIGAYTKRMQQACKAGQFDACNAHADVTLASGARREAEATFRRGLDLARRKARSCDETPSAPLDRCDAARDSQRHAEEQLEKIAELWRTGH